MQLIIALATILLPAAALDAPPPPASPKDVGPFYDRLAADLRMGRPLVATIYVALCDNDNQGIVKVKNRRICQGDTPEHNLYWAAAGGLWATLARAHWQQLAMTRFDDGALAVKAVWRKRFTPGGALRARGVREPFDVVVVGLGYRGSRIRTAMMDYLRAVNTDHVGPSAAGAADAWAGGKSHVVGYIGHDYFYDVDDAGPLLAQNQGDSVLHKGVFALACTGHRLIRPAIQRCNAHIFLLNRTLGFPGAWAAEAILAAVAEGEPMRTIHRRAATAFAQGQGISLAASLGAFAYGDRALPPRDH
jgi:hypothetical protein